MLGSDLHQRKPRVLVILGAGSSATCGMPSVVKIGKEMKSWSQEYKAYSSDRSNVDIFNQMWKSIECYYGLNHYGISPNYEMILGEMTALADWLSPSPFGNPLIESVNDSRPATPFATLLDRSDPNHARIEILRQQTFLLQRLASYIRDKSRALKTQSIEFVNYKRFILRLREQFQLGIYNLNYDTLAYTAWPEAFNGFSCFGTFDPLRISRRSDWGFIYHLHGSVHHCIENKHIDSQITWKNDLGESFSDIGVFPVDMAQKFKPIPLTTLVAGGFKLDQILVDPYQTFYSALVRHAQEADAILIIGYGFGDLHVNRALMNRFERRYDDRPIPQVVILDKSSPEQLCTGRRQVSDFWAYELRTTFGTAFSTRSIFSSDESSTVESFLNNGEFETDLMNRVAIWHNGLEEAVSACDKVTERLKKTLS